MTMPNDDILHQLLNDTARKEKLLEGACDIFIQFNKTLFDEVSSLLKSKTFFRISMENYIAEASFDASLAADRFSKCFNFMSILWNNSKTTSTKNKFETKLEFYEHSTSFK